jgi:hypothetical protein
MKILQANVVFIGKYATNQKYSYLTTIDSLTKGDYVVTKSSTGLGIAKFVEYVPVTKVATSWLVQHVDLESHQKMISNL